MRYEVFRPSNGPRRVIDPGIERIANDMVRTLKGRTPRGTSPRDPRGPMAEGWRVDTGTVRPGWGVRLVVNDVPYSAQVEYGTRRMPARPVLGQTLAEYANRWGRLL
jgi:hypothetical protein